MNFIISIANNRFLRWGFVLAWTLFLTVLLIQPSAQQIIPTGIPEAPPSFEREVFFTCIHLLFFGFTAVLWCFALEKELLPTMTLLIAAIVLLSYGFVMEYAQGTIPGRTPQWNDIVANITGVVLGLAFFHWQTKQHWKWRN